MAENTVTSTIQDGQTLDVLHWFRQNQLNIENILGKKVSAMSLSFDAVTGYSMSYTEAPSESEPVA